MTYGEAKEKLENRAYSVYWEETLDTAIEALEKQIPKKPVVKDLYDKSGKIFDSEYHCSVCGRFICFTTELDIYNNYPYCHCGRAIDWSNCSCVEKFDGGQK